MRFDLHTARLPDDCRCFVSSQGRGDTNQIGNDCIDVAHHFCEFGPFFGLERVQDANQISSALLNNEVL